VLESNRDLVLRRLTECLARDRTKHQVAEVTSLGLVQMTRKRVGAGLLEAFSQQCECCNGRGVILTLEAPAETAHRSSAGTARRPVPVPAPPPRDVDSNGNGSSNGGGANGNGNSRGRGNGSDSRPANGRSGNRRSGGRSDNDWRTETTVADAPLDDVAMADAALADAALAGTVPADARLDEAALDSAPLGTSALGTSALDDAALDSAARGDGRPGDAAPARNGGRRTRRPTNGGTAFAAAVVEDTAPVQAAVVPVVTAAPDAQPEPAGFASVAVGADVSAAAPEDSGPPVRRTRAGSAVARVTVVSDPEPPAESAPAADLPVIAEAVSETRAEPEAPATEPEVAPESVTVVEPEVAPESVTVVEPDATPESVTVVEPEVTPEPAAVAESHVTPESVTLVEPDATSAVPEAAAHESVPVAEPEAAPVEPEATLAKFATDEAEPVAGTEREAPAPGTLAAPEDSADTPTPAAPDALVVTEEPANPVIPEDGPPADAPEAPLAQTEPGQATGEEHPQG
jgi:ribonuclease E